MTYIIVRQGVSRRPECGQRVVWCVDSASFGAGRIIDCVKRLFITNQSLSVKQAAFFCLVSAGFLFLAGCGGGGSNTPTAPTARRRHHLQRRRLLR